MSYTPRIPPADPKDLPRWLQEEFAAIAFDNNNAQPFAYLKVTYVAPDKPRDGMIFEADGTSWNPGAGAGTYMRRAGAWVKLG